MTDSKQVHANEVSTDAALARRLLAAQFPHWAALSLARVQADSTDNDMYRLGRTRPCACRGAPAL